MIISKTINIEMAHRVHTHKGKCQNIHGHSWRITIGVEGDQKADGMVMDFSDLKKVMSNIHDVYDHTLWLSEQDKILPIILQNLPNTKISLTSGIATSETLCHDIAAMIKNFLQDFGITLAFVKINETCSSEAILEEK